MNCSLSFAENKDKNGVSPNTISLPKGPGAIEGLGSSFQPMLNTGTAKYEVAISLPPGVSGHTPKLSLKYEGGQGDSPVGMGWKFGPGAIFRQSDKGIPRYVDGPNGLDDDHDGEYDEIDEMDKFIGLEGEELVELEDSSFKARIEGTFLRYHRDGNHWIAYLKDGTLLEFGLTQSARVTDQTGTKIFKWLLEKSTDTNGNVIHFYYSSFSGSDNQKYLAEVRYGPGSGPWSVFYFVSLTYEDRPDWKKDFRSGFLIKTTRRLTQIDIGIQGHLPDQCAVGDWNHDTLSDALIRRYVLSYDDSSVTSSFLSKVTRFCSNGTSYLPPISFTYSLFAPESSISAAGAIIDSINAPQTVMDNDLAELVDLNRDGLPDILKTDVYGGRHTCYYNLGATSAQAIEWDNGRDVSNEDGLALLLRLKDKEVHLADMDGDGLSDLIHTTFFGDVFYYTNQGNGSWGDRKQMSIQDTSPPAPFTNEDVKTSDLDFDKRMDVVMSTDTSYRVWFVLEQGKYSQEVRTSGAIHQGSIIKFSQTGVHLADMNGDRMSDVVRVRPTQVIYCANMGHGRFAESVTINIPDAVLTDGQNSQIARARFEDINGDGLSDLVIERAVSGCLWYWLNLGTDTLSHKYTITDMPTVFGSSMETRWADINGNGTTDLIYADSASSTRLRTIDIGELSGEQTRPNLLIGIDNGLGVYTQISYKSSTDFYVLAREDETPWTVTIPFPVSVISDVLVTTGMDIDTQPGEDAYYKHYVYRNGFYEDKEKAFRGFEQVTVTEPGDETSPTGITRHQFFTGGPDGADNDGDGQTDEINSEWHREEDALKGMVISIETRDEDDTLFSREENAWRVRNLDVSIDNEEVRFAYNEKTDKLIYEGTESPQTIRTQFFYDDFGNITQELKYGALSISGDELFTYIEYINDEGRWIVDKPKRRYQTDGSHQKVSEAFSYYDGDNYTGLGFGSIDKGNLTRQQEWETGSSYINTIRNAYDAYGNIIGIMDGNNSLRSLAWDTILHIYPVSETIEVGNGLPDLVISVDYNYGLGVITQSTGFNGEITSYAYDRFGRIVKIIRPGDSSGMPTQRFAYIMADPENNMVYEYNENGDVSIITGISTASQVQTYQRETSGLSGTFDAIQYVDGMSRKLARVEEAESGHVVKESVLFNSKGTPRYAFLPYESPTADYVPPAISNAKAETRYDATGRGILQINPPDKTGLITQASNSFLPLSKTETDENNHLKTYISDGLERLIEVQEQNLGEIYITRYTFDPLNNLTRIVDAQNNEKTLIYDGLKRKREMNDPDAGRKTYSYDNAGNLIRTLDNKAQEIIYAYDRANRLISENYMDDNGIVPDVAYFYDDASPDFSYALNLKGKLAYVQDLSGAQFFSYDANGNVKWSVKRIDLNGLSHDFRSDYEYDAMNRVTSMTYPDGDFVSYTYNNRTLLDSVPGIVSGMDYHPSGQISSIEYTNGVSTDYSYDPRQRLSALSSVSALQANTIIQDLAYTMDGVGNIMGISDGRTIPPESGQNATQSFGYDGLDRLTHAEGPGYGAINFAYDKIGNMVSQQSPAQPDPKHIDDVLVNLGAMNYGGGLGTQNRVGRFPGDAPGPHAVTSTQSGLAYDYDDNGNMSLHAQGDIYTWDFMDRLIRVQKGSVDTRYTYDFSGQRTTKTTLENSQATFALYAGKTYEIRDGKPIKYVFSDTRRLAQVEGMLTDPTGATTQTLKLYSGWNLVSLTIEPDIYAIADALDSIDGKYTDVWMYDTATAQYIGYVPGEGILDLSEIHARTGYLIYMVEPAVLLMSGTYSEDSLLMPAGWNLIASPCRNAIPVEQAFAPISGQYESVWAYNPASQQWQNFFPDGPAFANTLQTLSPGTACWVLMKSAETLAYAQTPADIHFYHPDHLGSSSVVTNADGVVTERTEFYPFGRPRHEERVNFNSAYKYTGKELDVESGLMYYEARYYDPVVGRFISVDPEFETYLPSKERKAPQHFPNIGGIFNTIILNLYTYCGNSPHKYVDPDGRKLVFAQGSSPEFKQKVLEALKILKEHKLLGILKALHKRHEIVTIKEGKKLDEFAYDPNTKTIIFNPLSGLKVGPDTLDVQSPELGLLHESAHALQHLQNPTKYRSDKGAFDPKYGNLEEKRVIEGIEKYAAKKLKEPIRHDHSTGQEVLYTKQIIYPE